MNKKATVEGLSGPLTGLRVLDLGVLVAGPMTASLMADYGAEVINVEHPDGDPLREWHPQKNGIGLWWKVTGRNKKNVTLNLNYPEAQEIAFQLASQADVVVENFRPGTLERWNLGYDRLSKQNPGLILVRITGYGQYGPYAQRPGYGTIAEAMSGIPSFSGFPECPPTFPSFPMADVVTATYACMATLAALQHRNNTGDGQVIDVALYETIFRLVEAQVIGYDQLGIVKKRVGNRLEEDAPRNTYKTTDGVWIAVSASSENTFRRLCQAIGKPELADDPRFCGNSQRVRNVEELDEILSTWFQEFKAEEAMRILAGHDVVAGPVYDIQDIFEDPHYQARENIVSIDDPDLGAIRMQNVVPKFSKTPGRVAHAAGALGQHNDEVFGEMLGLTPQILERLREIGAI